MSLFKKFLNLSSVDIDRPHQANVPDMKDTETASTIYVNYGHPVTGAESQTKSEAEATTTHSVGSETANTLEKHSQSQTAADLHNRKYDLASFNRRDSQTESSTSVTDRSKPTELKFSSDMEPLRPNPEDFEARSSRHYNVPLDDIDKIMDSQPSLAPEHKRPLDAFDVSELRTDIMRISNDIENGDTLYRRAQHRITSLVKFVEEAEVAISLLEGYEQEAVTLKSTNSELNNEIQDYKVVLDDLKSEYALQHEELTRAKADASLYQKKMQAAIEAYEDFEQELKALKHDRNKQNVELERQRTENDIHTQEKLKLQQTTKALSLKIESLQSEKLFVSKSEESLRRDYDVLKQSNSGKDRTLTLLRTKVSELQDQNKKLRADYVELQDNLLEARMAKDSLIVKRNKQLAQLESNVGNSHNEVLHKNAMIDELQAQLNDMQEKQTAYALERHQMKKIIQTQREQLAQSHAELSLAQDSLADLDHKYNLIANTASHISNMDLEPQLPKANSQHEPYRPDTTQSAAELDPEKVIDELVQAYTDQSEAMNTSQDETEITPAVAANHTSDQLSSIFEELQRIINKNNLGPSDSEQKSA